MADVVVFTRGEHKKAELSRPDAIEVRDWATEGLDEQALQRKLKRALDLESDRATVVLTDDDLYDIRSALIRVLNVIEKKDPPLTSAQQNLRDLAQGPILP